ncbi:hypothetical protein G4X40_11700 [Rhodococcus sp. D2-41]|uniref:Uncharacterized protein n=1 Tax=Speluncibacter jeojiensis TaxID=2710754 RepID=A0A9X4LYV8_9ACTN|nr:hypothetical protein [Rhodococcus sp. D2-41]MDG3010812.1 hypothetical protein [Rhodococcus sp. D2-41]MDG3013784.1 hypothetical protein [Corynebacteriales bacterium D3-21]
MTVALTPPLTPIPRAAHPGADHAGDEPTGSNTTMSVFFSSTPTVDSVTHLDHMSTAATTLPATSKAQRTMRAVANAERNHIQAAREALGAI